MTGQCLATLTGHSAAITCFQHDSRLNRIVSGSDGGVKLWELKQFGEPRSLVLPSSTAALVDGDGTGVGGRTVDDVMIPFSSNVSSAQQQLQKQYGTETVIAPASNLPQHGRHVRDLVTSANGVWRVQMDRRRLVTALQKEEQQTWFEVLDFGDT